MTSGSDPLARPGSEEKRPRRPDGWVLGSLLLTFAGAGLAALLSEAAVFGFTAILVVAFLLLAWRVTGSPRLGWLLLFGLVVGVLELAADWYHVVRLGSLVYTDYFGFRLLASPSYMPLGWWLTAVQFGYLALRLEELLGRRAALAAVAALGMTVPPCYEEFGAAADAWHYTTSGPALSEAPVWVIVTYGGVMLVIGAAALSYREGAWRRAVLAGVAAGAGIFAAGLAGHALLA